MPSAFFSTRAEFPCGRAAVLVASVALAWAATAATAADRTTCFLPLAANTQGAPLTTGVLPDEAYGAGTPEGWNAYMRVWRAHHADPADPNVRRFLGLPLTGVVDAQPKAGRSAPRSLGWRAGSYRQVSTPHFTIYSRAKPDEATRVAEDLERCYWVWTQMFFPLWEGCPQVRTALTDLSPQQSVVDFLKRTTSRITVRRKLRVILFAGADEYRRTLRRSVPGIERSTGYYSDSAKTIYLYADDSDDAETRRHEMVHQLFREATRSGLGVRMPADRNGFWLIEGIAGYFESLQLGVRLATVGGWDSSRLQFARFRILALGDEMPMADLQRDGRVAAQRRADLSRWYAHAIAQTHRLMDSPDRAGRQWVYRRLAEHYLIDSQLPPGRLDSQTQRIQRFLAVGDAELTQNAITRSLPELCLAGCQVTAGGLATIPESRTMNWLDLSRLPIGNDAVRRLAPDPTSLRRLSLEATQIDSELKDWLGKAQNLLELDLSSTRVNDSVIGAIADAVNLQILFVTGSQVSDASIDTIASLRQLQSVDLQRTGVTAQGVNRLRQLRPNLTINPLEVR